MTTNLTITLHIYTYKYIYDKTKYYSLEKQTMELPLFAILQRTPRVALTLAFVLIPLTIVPALYSLLANPILPLPISSSDTDHTRLSQLNSSSNQTPSPVNGPIPAPLDHTPSRHRASSPENGPMPAPPNHTPLRHRKSSSGQRMVQFPLHLIIHLQDIGILHPIRVLHP